MLIELQPNTSQQEEDVLIKRLSLMGFQAEKRNPSRLVVVKGMDHTVDPAGFETLPFVKKVHPLNVRFKLASIQCQPAYTTIRCKHATIGGGSLFIIGGPCSIESEKQIQACAETARAAGAQALRGGAFKPRTSPYEFQGMGEEGLKLLAQAGKDYGLITVSEVMDLAQVELALKYVDILQVGARNMQNFNLLKELGKVKQPILLKRGLSATYQDLLMAAEYILSEGNPHVILCERGIRTFETHTRNTLDLNAVPALRALTHLPIIVDPSHGTGLRKLVVPMARAAVAVGADGVIIEMHPDPDQSVSDAAQTIDLESFKKLMPELRRMHQLVQNFKCV